jgi:hypothetical protein
MGLSGIKLLPEQPSWGWSAMVSRVSGVIRKKHPYLRIPPGEDTALLTDAASGL